MVSLRCIEIVQEELKKLSLKYVEIDFGMVDTLEIITQNQLEQLKVNLLKSGLELIDSETAALIEEIKSEIITVIHSNDVLPLYNIADFITKKINKDFVYLDHTFSEVKGITIEQFIILQKVEKIKELVLYYDYSFTEISQKLQYSSVATLSSEFKKITGLPLSFYKQLKKKRKKLASTS